MDEQSRTNVRPRHEFIVLIKTQYEENVTGILKIGQLLLQAKIELPHGEFGYMIARELPFGRRMAEMYMKVAANPVLSKPKHVSQLPASISTLYHLTKLPDELLESLLRRNIINPEIERKQVEQHVKQWKQERYDWLNLEANLLWIVEFTTSYPEPNQSLARRIINPIADDGFTARNLVRLKDWFAELHQAYLAWEQERKRLLAEHETMVEREFQHVTELRTRIEENEADQEDVADDEEADHEVEITDGE
jgi:hypothetical protein